MAAPKIALVTGGSRGLGKDMALSLARAGHDVILTYQSNADLASAVVADIKALGRKAAALPLDCGAIATLDAFLASVTSALEDTFGVQRFDFLIHNAGMGATIPIVKATEEDFDRFMNVHFKCVYFLTQKALPIMNDGGRIITISTGTTRFCNPGYSMYASAKSATECFTRYLAKEMGSRGIRANTVAPGPVETDFNSANVRENAHVKSFLSGLSPLGRVGAAEDIGGVVAFLCSPEAGWINGQRIEVSGGISL